jgi:hypothetical protein
MLSNLPKVTQLASSTARIDNEQSKGHARKHYITLPYSWCSMNRVLDLQP